MGEEYVELYSVLCVPALREQARTSVFENTCRSVVCFNKTFAWAELAPVFGGLFFFLASPACVVMCLLLMLFLVPFTSDRSVRRRRSNAGDVATVA